MNVLSRSEIVKLFTSGKLQIETPDNAHKKAATLAYSKENPFQQCSLDLRVGAIYIPESQDTELGGMFQPRKDGYVLGTGETVLIRTKEKITLPKDVGAICFSPSSMALKGVIITNMGHVDPGYSGYLHFTAINMGREKYDLRANSDTVCTMLLFKLTEDAHPYGHEYIEKIKIIGRPTEIPGSVYYSLPRLARDFVNVKKRAQDAAKETFNETKLWQIGVPVIAALVMAIASALQLAYVKPWEAEAQKLSSKIETLEKKIEFEKRISVVEKSIGEVETRKVGSRP